MCGRAPALFWARWFVLGLSCVSCAPEKEAASANSSSEPAGYATLTFSTQAFEVKAGEEREVCEYLVLPSDQDIKVVRFQMESGAGTHHMLLEAVNVDGVSPSVFDCVQEGMVPGYTPLVGTASPSEDIQLPENVALNIAGAQMLLVDQHYVNSTRESVLVSTEFVLTLAPEDADLLPASILFVNNWQFVLPPYQTTSQDVVCALDRDLNLSYMVPHTHDMGLSLSLSIRDSEADTEPQILIDQAGYSDLSSVDLTDSPIKVKADTLLSLQCTWFNYLDSPTLYPDEMCMVGILVFPAESAFYCDASGLHSEDRLP